MTEPSDGAPLDPRALLRMLRGDDVPWVFMVEAVRIAATADKLLPIIRSAVYRGSPSFGLAAPPVRPWLGLYRRHREIDRMLGVAEGVPDEVLDSDLASVLRQFALTYDQSDLVELRSIIAEAMPPAQRELIGRALLGVPFPPSVATIRTLLDGFEAEASLDDLDSVAAFESQLTTLPARFYMLVWLPCWVLHRTYPALLMRAAREGDPDALDRLLRLDKLALSEPRIASVVDGVMRTGRRAARQRVASAISGVPRTRLTKKAMRAGLGALIADIADAMDLRVTAPQIGVLFDRIERVRSGAAADPDIPAGESWSKAIQRNRSWPGIPRNGPDNR